MTTDPERTPAPVPQRLRSQESTVDGPQDGWRPRRQPEERGAGQPEERGAEQPEERGAEQPEERGAGQQAGQQEARQQGRAGQQEARQQVRAGQQAGQQGRAGQQEVEEPAQPLAPTVVPSRLGLPRLSLTPTGAVRWWTAGTALAIAGLLSLGAFAGTTALLAAVVLATAVLAWGWPTLLDLPSPRGTTSVVAAGGAGAAVAVALTREEPLLQWLALAIAAAVVGEFVHQLGRRDGRPRLVESATGSVAGVVVLASMSAWIALPRTESGAGGVLVTAVPVAVALSLQLLPLPGRIAAAGGTVTATLLGGLLGGLLPDTTVVAGLVAAGLAAGVAVMLHRLLSVLPPAGSAPGWLALAIGPLASSGMVAYVALRLLVG